MKKYQISIFLSIISICGIIFHNYKLAKIYLKVDGKTKALFGITELVHLDMKVYIGLVSLTSLTFGIIGLLKKENKLRSTLSICLSGISIILIFIRFWKLMI